jgi:hypothetical protein
VALDVELGKGADTAHVDAALTLTAFSVLKVLESPVCGVSQDPNDGVTPSA